MDDFEVARKVDETDIKSLVLTNLKRHMLLHPYILVKHLVAFTYKPLLLHNNSELYFFNTNLTGYLQTLYYNHGKDIYLTGIDTSIAINTISNITWSFLPTYFDLNYNGFKDEDDKSLSEYDMTEHQSIVKHTRAAFKQCTFNAVLAVVQRPFYVVLTRQLAFYMFNNASPPFVIPMLKDIGDTEGLPGLFSGVIPAIIHTVFATSAYWALRFFFSRFIVHTQRVAIKKNSSYLHSLVSFVKENMNMGLWAIWFYTDLKFDDFDREGKLLALGDVLDLAEIDGKR
ncbi:unnamed protein product [Bursaphelenchus okinawaensis]|uniref:Uncharacterized protein n=1 Tax=Bursaphelenchus okinawaensis TaxID=465554 RepID=A0A811KBV1_9BILA|nr:unnamed protein product [Bursaphelenchus okinawaensis]CAG9097919.1 unnamed protein product [Bursaphelenchus okinawaensis]